jgi:hypothetical protein
MRRCAWSRGSAYTTVFLVAVLPVLWLLQSLAATVGRRFGQA